MTSPDKPIDFLYQSDWLVAVNKPAFRLAHPVDEPKEGDFVVLKLIARICFSRNGHRKR